VNVSRCPICNKEIQATAKIAPAFCSTRCQQIDLGKWLNEEYRMPVSAEEDSDVEEGAGDGHEA
jgi:endogenous inhibitor of DNA gyrase (YacG/DUF329 family)